MFLFFFYSEIQREKRSNHFSEKTSEQLLGVKSGRIWAQRKITGHRDVFRSRHTNNLSPETEPDQHSYHPFDFKLRRQLLLNFSSEMSSDFVFLFFYLFRNFDVKLFKTLPVLCKRPGEDFVCFLSSPCTTLLTCTAGTTCLTLSLCLSHCGCQQPIRADLLRETNVIG